MGNCSGPPSSLNDQEYDPLGVPGITVKCTRTSPTSASVSSLINASAHSYSMCPQIQLYRRGWGVARPVDVTITSTPTTAHNTKRPLIRDFMIWGNE